MSGKSQRQAAKRSTQATMDMFNTNKPRKSTSNRNSEDNHLMDPSSSENEGKASNTSQKEELIIDQTSSKEDQDNVDTNQETILHSTSKEVGKNSLLPNNADDSHLTQGQRTPISSTNDQTSLIHSSNDNRLIEMLANQFGNDSVVNNVDNTNNPLTHVTTKDSAMGGEDVDKIEEDLSKLTVLKPPPIKQQGNHQFSFASQSISESGIPVNKEPIPDQNKMITDLILERTKQMEQRDREEHNKGPPPQISIHDITSRNVLNTNVTPFSHEDNLPPFEHGCIAFHYFTSLRNMLDKCVRADLQRQFVKECLARRIIPRGFKLNKKIMAVEPSPQLKLAHYRICIEAEIKMMEAVVTHYTTAVPKLTQEFDEYFTEIKLLEPTGRRLTILWLVKFKNELVSTRRKIQQQKLENYSNDPSNQPPSVQLNNGEVEPQVDGPSKGRSTMQPCPQDGAARYDDSQRSRPTQGRRENQMYGPRDDGRYQRNQNGRYRNNSPNPNYRDRGQNYKGKQPNRNPKPQASRFQNDDLEDDWIDGDESWSPNDYRGSHKQLPQRQQKPRQTGNPRYQNQRRY